MAMALLRSEFNRLKDWAPRDHSQDKPKAEDHVKEMYSLGKIGGKFYFNPVVTFFSFGGVWAIVIWAMAAQGSAARKTWDAQVWVTDIWAWLYMITQNVWIVVLFYLLFKHYNLKLGKDDDKPEFSDGAYFAMLFSCGVATGLWYFSAEAMWHYEGYGTPRWMDEKMFNMNTRAEHAVMVTFFHWGLHGWIPYTVVGALIAILSYRRGFPMSMRFTMYPLIGEMVYGILGDMIEILSILCTIFGVCTSLGLGAMQINKGMVRLDRGTYLGKDYIGCTGSEGPGDACEGNTGMSEDKGVQICIIIGITLLATASVVMGLKKGIQVLSFVAFGLSVFILISILFMDHTWYILNVLTSSFGYYLWYLPKISFHTDAWEELGAASLGQGGAPDGRGGAAGWMNGWTIFYWGWWISWGPFVGTFLARISKGRKLGHFIIATLILPSIWSFVFLGIMGAAQIRMSNQAISAGLDGTTIATRYGSYADKTAIGWTQSLEDDDGNPYTKWVPVPDSVTRLYWLGTEDVLFEHLSAYGGQGWATFMTVITLICIVLYFITSSDSASFVVDIMAANGVEEPPLLQKIFWAFTEGAAACALLASASEDNPKAALNAVKAIPIILGLPFTFLLFWMCQGLVIVCKEEAGELFIGRRHFETFLLNFEPVTFVSFPFPFLGLGVVAEKVGWCNKIVGIVLYGLAWLVMVVFLCLGAADEAFAYMGAAMYFMLALAAAGLRVATRLKLGISGDMVSDFMACAFALPWAIGQMYAEPFDKQVELPKAVAEITM
mmetsp:Transcript_119171/g.299677  ORF Transcript_119171/g.299677 Transcript_119171/m.299677 type:complete len:777 (+) Transcript_119171:95-2425(+)